MFCMKTILFSDSKIYFLTQNDKMNEKFSHILEIDLDYAIMSKTLGILTPIIENIQISIFVCDFLCRTKKQGFVPKVCRQFKRNDAQEFETRIVLSNNHDAQFKLRFKENIIFAFNYAYCQIECFSHFDKGNILAQ